MKIKKNIYHVIFFDLLIELMSVILIAFGFFLGFETTKCNMLAYLLINGIIILAGIIAYCIYDLSCKLYYEFTENSIRIIKKGGLISEINYDKIHRIEYYTFGALMLGDPKGGKLIVYYLEDSKEKSLEISFLKRLIKKTSVKNLFVK